MKPVGPETSGRETSCAGFRAALEEALAGPEERRRSLGRHEHVSACPRCRAELEREERLEHALAQVPEPQVPRELASSLRARLAPARPAARDELDELLAQVPPPLPPAQLAQTVLAGLAAERPARRSRPKGLWLLAAAAAAVLAWGLFARRSEPDLIRQELARAAGELEADEDLLVYALERWELLHDEDLDVWLASLDPVDEFLIEVGEDELWPDPSTLGKGD